MTRPATGNPNEYDLLDSGADPRTPGTYVNPLTGTRTSGRIRPRMTEAERLPRPGRVEPRLHHRQAVPVRHDKAALVRLEAYNLFNHAQHVRAHATPPTSSSFTSITGVEDDFRRMQLGFKFEF